MCNSKILQVLFLQFFVTDQQRFVVLLCYPFRQRPRLRGKGRSGGPLVGLQRKAPLDQGPDLRGGHEGRKRRRRRRRNGGRKRRSGRRRQRTRRGGHSILPEQAASDSDPPPTPAATSEGLLPSPRQAKRDAPRDHTSAFPEISLPLLVLLLLLLLLLLQLLLFPPPPSSSPPPPPLRGEQLSAAKENGFQSSGGL